MEADHHWQKNTERDLIHDLDKSPQRVECQSVHTKQGLRRCSSSEVIITTP